MALFLDTKGYDVFESDEIFNHISSLVVHFHDIIKANGCDTGKLKSRTEILYEHVKKFLQSKSPNNVWSHLFCRGKTLVIENVLHLAEISLVLPTSNTETRCAFSFLWRTFFKERQSLKNVNLEHILRLRSDHDYSQERYEHAIELLLTRYPNEEVRHHPRRPGGHQCLQKRKNMKYVPDKSPSAIINEILFGDEQLTLSDISSDDWSEFSTD